MLEGQSGACMRTRTCYQLVALARKSEHMLLLSQRVKCTYVLLEE